VGDEQKALQEMSKGTDLSMCRFWTGTGECCRGECGDEEQIISQIIQVRQTLNSNDTSSSKDLK
jgi:hypothetical protein